MVIQELATPAPAFDAEMLNRVLAALSALPQSRKMTYDEFLRWADEDTLAEWVNGEAKMTSPAPKRHQLLSAFLERILGMFAEQHNLGIVLAAPFQMKLAQGREPDLLFVAKEHLERLKETHLDGPADLVIEIVSPESIGRDRGEKFSEYEQAGIPEYWLIDPQREQAEFYRLENNRYRLVVGGREGVYHSVQLPGFWLQLEWLWQPVLPSPIRILAQVAGVDPALVEAFEKALAGK